MHLHDEIRKIAGNDFVAPARDSLQREFSIAVRQLMGKAEARGITTAQRVPAFCTSIQTREFLEDNLLELIRVDGPASKKSTTVVVHYRFRNLHATREPSNRRSSTDLSTDPLLQLSGLLRGAIREGAAAFVHELRRDKDSNADVETRKTA